jgi:hypothetical protein
MSHNWLLTKLKVKVQVQFILRLAVYPKSVRLGVKTLDTHDQRFFQLNPCSHSPYVTPSRTRRWVCLLCICLVFREVYVSLIYSLLLNFVPFELYTSPLSSVSPGFAKQIMSILRILCYNGSLFTWTIVSLTTAKFKSLYWLNSVRVRVMLRPMVSRSVCLGIKQPSGAYDQIFITFRHLRVCWCGVLFLRRGRVCRLQLLLASPEQSFSGPSPVELVTIFCCLRFETSISSPPTTRRAMVKVFDPSSTRASHWLNSKLVPLITPLHGQRRKQRSSLL